MSFDLAGWLALHRNDALMFAATVLGIQLVAGFFGLLERRQNMKKLDRTGGG